MNAVNTATAADLGERVDRIALGIMKVLGVLVGLGLLAALGFWFLLWFTFKDATFGF